MSGKTFISVSDENASVPHERFSWQSDADAESRGHCDWEDLSIWADGETKKRRQYSFSEPAEGCRVALQGNVRTADWLRKTLLAVEYSQPCMQSPAKQTVAYFLLGEAPTQLEDLCELALEGKPWLWQRVLSYFGIGAR